MSATAHFLIDVGKLLPATVADYKASLLFLDRPRRWEAVVGGCYRYSNSFSFCRRDGRLVINSTTCAASVALPRGDHGAFVFHELGSAPSRLPSSDNWRMVALSKSRSLSGFRVGGTATQRTSTSPSPRNFVNSASAYK
jgi:hypothetical protein